MINDLAFHWLSKLKYLTHIQVNSLNYINVKTSLLWQLIGNCVRLKSIDMPFRCSPNDFHLRKIQHLIKERNIDFNYKVFNQISDKNKIKM